LPQVVIFRVEAAMLYFNTEYISKVVMEKVRSTAPKLVVCDLSTTPNMDLAGVRMLSKINEELTVKGIVLRLAEIRSSVRDILRAEGLEKSVGPINRHISVSAAIESIPM
jgi:MFS superfamily sulfate permease-like transporter